MKKTIGIAFVLVALVVPVGGARGAVDTAALDRAFAELAKFDWGQEAKGQGVIDSALRAAHDDGALRAELEKRMIAVLGSNASRAAKDYGCRCLARIGTEESVPALAAMLGNEELSHMARYALERIPGEAPGKAMVEALAKTSGKMKAGIIISLGVRRDAGAVDALVAALRDSDAAVSGAAAAALGEIAAQPAALALVEWAGQVPSDRVGAADDALLRVGRRLLEQNQTPQAVGIFMMLFKGRQPVAGLAGLVASGAPEANAALVSALGGQNASLRLAAGRFIAEMPNRTAQPVIDVLAKLPAEGQVTLLGAIGAKRDSAARSAVLPLLKSEDVGVRVAAIEAVGRVGEVADVALLAGLAAGGRKESAAARKALASLPGKGMDESVAGAIEGAPAPVAVELIKSLGARGARGQCDRIAALAGDANAEVALAAIEALGAIGDEQQAPALVKRICSGQSAEAATAALKSICGRVREKAAPAVLWGWRDAGAAAKVKLVSVLGVIGGAEALGTIRQAIAGNDGEVKEAAIRALAEWSSAEAVPALLEIAKTGEKPAHRTLALRGFVRLVGESSASEADKLKSLAEAMNLAQGAQEKKFVIGALGEIASAQALAQVAPCVAQPELADEAGAAAVKIVSKLKNPDKAAVGAVLKQVIKAAKAGQVVEGARKEMKRLGIGE